jgi:type VI secretion system secreted protein VgrG
MAATGISRDNALLSMTSPFGKDVLIPTAVVAEEALSQPFLCSIDLVSARETIDPDDLLYQPVCLTVRLMDLTPRYIHGLVRHFAATGPLPRDMFGYRLEVVPALWFLSQTEDCRIFENKSTKQVVQTILGEHGVRFQFRVGDTPPRPLTVQYNETDLDFVTRLMAEEGWFYLFNHEATGHTLVITESNTSFKKVPDGSVTLRPGDDVTTLAQWRPGRATAHGQVIMGDYDPEQPSTKLSGQTDTTFKAAGKSARDPFHWPARAVKNDLIAQRTRYRIEAAEAAASLAEGEGFNPNFFAGGRIQVAVRVNGTPKEFLLHGVTHHASDETWCNGSTPPSYTNSFTAFPTDLPWRPAQTVQKPRMEGLHSATVIGPDGQEIHTDELGRVKLRFRWDRRSDATPGGAVWVRVMQAWSGTNFGWTFIPRVGTEVGVSFVDGDPDRPIVVGQIHNGDQHPPWSLPDQKTRGGLRSRSTPDGGEENCSEFWFDDKKGSELIHLHSERDLAVEVENDATYQIDNNRTATIKQGNDSLTVKQGNRCTTISMGNDSIKVEQGSRTVDVPMGDHTIKSQQGNISVETELGNIALKNTQGDISANTSMGNITLKTALGSVTIEAMQSLTLKVGQSSVTVDQSGVSIKGMMVKVEGQIMTSLKGPMTQIDADAMLKASGGIMMLN